jgi:hypothetical protein
MKPEGHSNLGKEFSVGKKLKGHMIYGYKWPVENKIYRI